LGKTGRATNFVEKTWTGDKNIFFARATKNVARHFIRAGVYVENYVFSTHMYLFILGVCSQIWLKNTLTEKISENRPSLDF